ncbi:MAG: hypothetical protein WDM96_16785 [Lacunisphaera sp.]
MPDFTHLPRSRLALNFRSSGTLRSVLLGLAGFLSVLAAPVRAEVSPSSAPAEVVLFGFDNHAFPFQNHVETHLYRGLRPRLVLRPGPAPTTR